MFHKLKLKFNNRGYLQIDIAFGLFIFLIFFILVYNFYAHYRADLNVENDVLFLQNEAKDICFLLSKSSGFPNDWESDINDTNFFGFKKINSTELDLNKFSQFTNENYFTILDKVNISGNLGIKIIGLNSTTQYLSFGFLADDVNVKYANYQCYSNYNSENVKIFVEVWK